MIVCRVKLERILTLEEEASELKAMMVRQSLIVRSLHRLTASFYLHAQSHLDDKVKVLFQQGKDINEKRKALASRLKEAQSQGKEMAAQHIAAEVAPLPFYPFSCLTARSVDERLHRGTARSAAASEELAARELFPQFGKKEETRRETEVEGGVGRREETRGLEEVHRE